MIVVALLCSANPVNVAAQASGFAVEPWIGTFHLDDGDLSEFGVEVDSGRALGGRLSYSAHPRLAVAANFAWVPLEARAGGPASGLTLDASARLYYASAEATVVSLGQGRADLLALAGIGGVTIASERDESFTNPLVGLGLAARWAATSRLRPRLDVRDYLHFCGETEPGRLTGCLEDTVLDHLLFSIGLEVLF